MDLQLDKVLSSDQLPSLPQVALRVVQLAQQPEPDTDALIAIIRTDPAISGKILKTANSALFGFRQSISSIEAGVPILGAKLVRTLVLSFSLAGHRSPSSALNGVYQRLWRTSLTQAVAAETLALRVGASDSDVYFMTGLLQDIGVLALLRTYPDEYVSKILSKTPVVGPIEMESRELGFTHLDASIALCRNWGLDEAMVQAIAQHHGPLEKIAPSSAEEPSLALALMTAALCADHIEVIRSGVANEPSLLKRVLADYYSLAGDDVREFLQDVHLRAGEVAATFSVDVGTMPTMDEILRSAKSTLEEIAIQSQIEAIAAEQKVERATQKLKRVETQREEMRQHAYRDQLTGAYNRHFMSNVLEMELEQCVDRGAALGFLFLDIDKFKGLNDTHGHALGDQALQAVSEVLHQTVRETDLIIRYGGDEFLVVLLDITEERFHRTAERICRQIREAKLDCQPAARISSSVGAVFCSPDSAAPIDPDTVIREVDRAMYDAKQRGGDQVRHYRLDAQGVAVSEQALES